MPLAQIPYNWIWITLFHSSVLQVSKILLNTSWLVEGSEYDLVTLKVEHDFYFYIDFYQLDLVKGKLSWWAAKSSWESEVDLVNSTLTSESEVEFTNSISATSSSCNSN